MIPTLQAVKQNWNAFAGTYSRFMENTNVQVGLSLARMLHLSSAKNILEVGSGTGHLSLELLQTLPPGIKYTSLDISDEMTKIANQRKQSLLRKITDIEHSFIIGNAEDLSSIPNESVDIYLANLCLHLTPNPNKALQEAMRVVRKRGKIGFSVLGDPEKSSFFTIFNDTVKKYNFEQKKTKNRSIYHLGSREAMIKLAQENGIHVDFCWKEKVVMAIFNEDEFESVSKSPANLKTLSQFDKATQMKIMEDTKKGFLELKKNLMPLEVDNVLLVGTKQE